MSIFAKLSKISRKRKLELFYKLIEPTDGMKILDVGAEVNPFGNKTMQFIDNYQWKGNITAANISDKYLSLIKQRYPEVETRVCDACSLPWPDKYFDVVYSNAVIEHVGDFERQAQMASEIMRVGKKWFVTTPNRWYPFEFHMRLPLVTWLPGDMYLLAGRCIRYNHDSKKYCFGNSDCGSRLMSSRKLKKCFPTSQIIKQRVTFMPETIIAVGGVNFDNG